VLINSLFYPIFKIWEVIPINLIKTLSIPIFLSNVALAKRPIVLINSESSSELPYLRMLFT